MAILRVNKTKNYTVMSNQHLHNKDLSLKAKGLLSVMLALPDDWDYSIAGLVAISKENETCINSTLKELREHGYLVVTKLMPNETKSGRIEYIYDIFEDPKQGTKKQGLEIQPLEIQPLENRAQLNIKKQNTEKINTNNIIILDYLNEKAGTHYKPVESNLKFINARLKDYTVEDLEAVIDKKVAEWKGTDMQKYLRPETLFNATKFESYINEPEKATKNYRYSKEELDNVFDNLEEIEI